MTHADRRSKVFVAGHGGMAGSALVRSLEARGDCELILRTRDQVDLSRQSEVEDFFAGHAIDTVYLSAARVGGIRANSEFPADFIRDNLQIQTNVIDAAHRAGVRRLLFLGSSCIYPRDAGQPIREESLLSGPLESTNQAYAVAKIAGIKMCESYRAQFGSDFRSVMPTNLYGPNDNFELENSHVLPALLRKFHTAADNRDAEVEVWGSGRPRREFLHVDDMAAACVHLMNLPEDEFWSAVPPGYSHVNVGTGIDCSIRELAERIAGVTGFDGAIRFDSSMPDGTPRKLLDVSRIHALGWRHRISLQAGLEDTYRWMTHHWDSLRR